MCKGYIYECVTICKVPLQFTNLQVTVGTPDTLLEVLYIPLPGKPGTRLTAGS